MFVPAEPSPMICTLFWYILAVVYIPTNRFRRSLTLSKFEPIDLSIFAARIEMPSKSLIWSSTTSLKYPTLLRAFMNRNPKTAAITAKMITNGMKSISIVADAGAAAVSSEFSIPNALSVKPASATVCDSWITFSQSSVIAGETLWLLRFASLFCCSASLVL